MNLLGGKICIIKIEMSILRIKRIIGTLPISVSLMNVVIEIIIQTSVIDSVVTGVIIDVTATSAIDITVKCVLPEQQGQ